MWIDHSAGRGLRWQQSLRGDGGVCAKERKSPELIPDATTIYWLNLEGEKGPVLDGGDSRDPRQECILSDLIGCRWGRCASWSVRRPDGCVDGDGRGEYEGIGLLLQELLCSPASPRLLKQRWSRVLIDGPPWLLLGTRMEGGQKGASNESTRNDLR